MTDNLKFPIGISFSPFGQSYARYGENVFATIKSHDYDAVDINIANTDNQWYTFNDAELSAAMEAFSEQARSAEITISQIHGPWRYPPQDATEENRHERLTKMKKSAKIAALLGCKYLVIHPIMPFGTKDVLLGKETETVALNHAFFRQLVPYAKEVGVTICLENMPMVNFSLATPEQILEFVKEFDDENLKVCLDTGHVAVFPQLSIGDEVRRLGDALKVLHIHDNLGDRDAHLYPGRGITHWPSFFEALEQIQFPGFCSLETAPASTLNDNDFVQESIALNRMFRSLMKQNIKP